MKSPLWILNTMLALLLLIFFLVIVLVRPKKIARASLAVSAHGYTHTEDTPHVDPSLIYKNDLFATYQIAQRPAQEELDQKMAAVPQPPLPKQAPVLSRPSPQFLPPLAVTLKGIMYSSNDKDNRAIVSDNQSKKESLHKTGDSILDAEIIYIGSNKVIFIRSNGQQETLFVTQDDAQTDPIYTKKDAPADIIKQTMLNEFAINYEPFIAQVQSLAQFIEMLDITTAFQKGKIVGCRIGKFGANSVGPLLGLQPGDVVTSINNIPTTTTTNRVAIYHDIKNRMPHISATVSLIRQGQPLELKYVVNHIKNQQEDEQAPKIKQDSLPRPKFTNTIDQVPQYAGMIQQVQNRDQDAMLRYGGRNAMISRTEPERLS